MLYSIAVALVNMLILVKTKDSRLDPIYDLCTKNKIAGLSKLEFDILKTCFFYTTGGFLSTHEEGAIAKRLETEADEVTCQNLFSRSQEAFIPNSDPFYD